jgi:heme exporter protein D
MSGFFAMGGYAAFVWPAYAVTLLVLGGLLVQSLRQYRARQRELERIERKR